MGYNTAWNGSLEVYNANEKRAKLPKKLASLIVGLSRTRRMGRNTDLLAKRLRMSKERCERLYGMYGEKYIEKDFETTAGQTVHPDITDYNRPPPNQPGLWCDFTYNAATRTIEWNEADKTYDGAEWIDYINRLLQESGYHLKGTMNWEGEDPEDTGEVVV